MSGSAATRLFAAKNSAAGWLQVRPASVLVVERLDDGVLGRAEVVRLFGRILARTSHAAKGAARNRVSPGSHVEHRLGRAASQQQDYPVPHGGTPCVGTIVSRSPDDCHEAITCRDSADSPDLFRHSAAIPPAIRQFARREEKGTAIPIRRFFSPIGGGGLDGLQGSTVDAAQSASNPPTHA